jgi:uncharacterized RDD family membrane protein YckC
MNATGSPRSLDALSLDSPTGVALHVVLAGAGARAFAYIVDWWIRLALFAAWYVLAALVYNRELSLAPPLDPEGAWFAVVVAPGAGLYFLYHAALEIAMRGRTPGKRIVGVRLIARDGGTPTVGALITRNVFRLIDSFPVFYGVGIAATMLTRDRVRIGDLAAGTLLVYEARNAMLLTHASETALGQELGSTELEVMNELLRRWDELAPAAREHVARTLLERSGSPAPADADNEALRSAIARMAFGTRT